MIVAGIDIGAISTKTVILNNNQFVAYNIIDTGLSPAKAAVDSLQQSLTQCNMTREQINYIITTGHGRRTIDFANEMKSEIMACAKGAKAILPSTRVILDLGGQGIRIIKLDPNGTVDNFVTNDKCSSGTGCFLDAMAFALGVDLKHLGNLAEKSEKAESISTKCTIFAESEVISLVARGKRMEDIIKGLHESVAKKVVSLTKPLLPPDPGPHSIFLAGGVGKNKGVVQALNTALGMQIFVPNDPQVITAYGAALLAPQTIPQKAAQPQSQTQTQQPQQTQTQRPTPTPQPTPQPRTQPTPQPTQTQHPAGGGK
jgi:predicted CoA-substrate-specific enzyme activase